MTLFSMIVKSDQLEVIAWQPKLDIYKIDVFNKQISLTV